MPSHGTSGAHKTLSFDLHDKLGVYRRNQAQEYLVWPVHESRLDWWQLQDGVYAPLQADAKGIVRSVVFPGLWLAVPAMLDGNLADVIGVLQSGLETPEHRAVVDQVQTRQG